MKRYFLTLIHLIAFFSITWAQQASDALRYSSSQYGGTARSIGVGNSMSVFGGDFGTISINPAGLATYRRSDLSISMGYLNVSTNALLKGNNNINWNEPTGKVTFNNVGLVFSSQPYGNSKWKTGNFAVGLNKLTDFKRSLYYQGTSSGSLVTVFKNDLIAGVFDEYGSQLAYDAAAIYDSTIAGKKYYYSDFDGVEGANVNRSQNITTAGRVTEMVVSYAGNFDEKLNMGVTLGITFAKYSFSNDYNENDPQNEVRYFNSLNYKDKFEADGTGVNLKIGAIYRPTQTVRVGVAFHTPTLYQFSEKHTVDMNYTYVTSANKVVSTDALSPEGISKYNINTPWRGVASIGVLMGKNGFVTAEAEYVDYASAKIRFDTPDSIGSTRIQELKEYENKVNNKIKDTYKSAINLRFGGELVLDVFRVRGGVNLLGNANKNDKTFRTAYTMGAGVRGENIYFDVAYRFEKQSYGYQPYITAEPVRQPDIDISSTQHNFVATLGFKF